MALDEEGVAMYMEVGTDVYRNSRYGVGGFGESFDQTK